MMGGTWLAQLGDHATLDLGVMSWSPVLRVEILFKKKEKKEKKKTDGAGHS